MADNNRKTTDKKLSGELQRVLKHINDDLVKEYPTSVITPDYLILSILDINDSVGGKVLSKTMLTEAIQKIKDEYCNYLSQSSSTIQRKGKPRFDKMYDKIMDIALDYCNEEKASVINSGHVLAAIMSIDGKISDDFITEGVSIDEIKSSVSSETEELENELVNAKKTILKRHRKKQAKENVKIEGTENPVPFIIKSITSVPSTTSFKPVSLESNEVENNLIDLNKKALQGEIDNVYNCESINRQIFGILSKRDRNNVVLVGDSGVGKTAISRNIANILISPDCPKLFKGKKLMEMDFLQMTSNTAYQGAVENTFKAVISQAKKKGNYIFFLDNIHDILSEHQRYGGIETILNIIMAERDILFITTTNQQDYKQYIEGTSMEGYSQKLAIEEPTLNEAIEILENSKDRYETFHNVTYSKEDVETATKLAKRYITERHLPASAIEILDEAGANHQLNEKTPKKIKDLEQELGLIQSKKKFFDASPEESKNYEVFDSLVKQEISVKAQLTVERKIDRMHKQKEVVPVNEIYKVVEEKTGIPLEQITVSDREALKGLNDKLKKFVIGQDEAVDEVCRVVKRQRVGMANPNKPAVLFFGGATGCGKTYLAKKLAEEVFGDEKYLIKLDMSEYSEKISVSKLTGSSPGYVGFENGGQLTEAVKKKKHCILLLDEIEKADEQVHNVFLQLFDEGRLTDGQGVTVDFRNVIVIMTSNVGAKQVSERGKGFGFSKNQEEKTESIIEESLKKEFRPEFLNRIDKIVYFRNLDDENYKNIIKIGLDKIENKIKELGYKLARGFKSKKTIDKLFEKVKDSKEMGARPINRILQSEIEDRISDYLIDNELDKGAEIPSSIIA